MRILLLTRDFPPQDGGIAQFAYGLSRALAEAGHEVTVQARWNGPSPADIPPSVPNLEVNWVGGRSPAGSRAPSERTAFAKYVASAPPDLIIGVHWKAFRALAGAAKRSGFPSVLTIHAKEVTGRRPWHQRVRLRRALLNATRVVTVSGYTAEQVEERFGIPRKKIDVIHPGVDTRIFTPGAPSPDTLLRYGVGKGPMLLTVARLVRRKGHDRVIRALAALREEFPSLQYVICGGGDDSLRSEFEHLTRKLGVDDAVIFTGRVPADDLLDLYRACEVCVMTSRFLADRGDSEGFGITYLEAGACEKPVVGGREGGVVDAIEDGVTGLLVDPNSTEDVADALARLLRDPEESRSMGRAGRARVEDAFSWAGVAQRFLGLFA